MGTFDEYPDGYNEYSSSYRPKVSKLDTVVGVVQEVKFGKVLVVNGEQYSAFDGSQLQGARAGDTVEFDYRINMKNGKTYRNIQKDVNITGKGSGGTLTASGGYRSAPPTQAANLPPHYQITKGYATKLNVFPVPKDHPDRSILRQNAGNIASALLAPTLSAKSSVDDILSNWKQLASAIERHTSGEADDLEAQAAMDELSKTE